MTMNIAVVTPNMRSGERGGAEELYTGLVSNLRQAGYVTEQVEVLIDESTFDGVLQSYETCRTLDLRAYDLVISTKAPTYMLRHPNHVSYLLHTIRVFYDMFEREYGSGTREQHRQRATIHALDREGLHPDRVRRHFSNGHETFKRLYDADPFWRQIPFRALHHPPALTGYKEPRPGRYVFLPGRLHRWKRADLIIRAFQHLPHDIPLKISGTGEDEPALRRLAAGDARIEFLGRVNNDDLLDLYASALVVPFVPLHEDYGLVTIEAFRSGKAVITCSDSGEPTVFVRDGETGFVVEPSPRAIAERLGYLIDHPEEAATMGENGRQSVDHITWERLIEQLVDEPIKARTTTLSVSNGNGHHASPRSVSTLEDAAQGSANATFRVSVLDMQPIDPPVGGGRLRLLGLYHGLGRNLPTTYRGTYDWPGEPHRRLRLSETLNEIDVPLSAAHFAAAEEWHKLAGGKGVIDVAFAAQAHRSPEFVASAVQGVQEGDIVVFSHPWVYPLVKDQLEPHAQLVVYDSQNVESLLRAALLDDGGLGTELVKLVLRAEAELCHVSHLVLACSHEDRRLFHELYGVPYSKILVVPNATFTETTKPATPEERLAARETLGLEASPVAVFLGSAYGPNVEAAEFIRDELAPALPDVQFCICGGVGEALSRGRTSANARITGRIDDETRDRYLTAADLAVNPMFSGSGTNIKMFDFMAVGLPIVSTPIGARGIVGESEMAYVVRPPHDLASAIRALVDDPAYAASVGTAARRLAEQTYSWERVSRQLGTRLHRSRGRLGRRPPFFSVIVASYERHGSLRDLLGHLSAQTWRDFEVIIVDQSRDAWRGWEEFDDLDILYIHTDVKGAVGARNTAAWHAGGDVLAFTDDDCQPMPDWLARARPYFDAPGNVGVEGFILSDKRDDPDWRAVTNVNFEGVGFMTANLFLRRETFMAIDGFDCRFDHPHFREDTDLGWRALEMGQIPFGPDVRVYHPPQSRESEREGLAERVRYFEKDALLMSKHPERYRRLFLYESHYRQTAGFGEHFLRGAAKYEVEVDDFYRALLAECPPIIAPEEVVTRVALASAHSAITPEDVLR